MSKKTLNTENLEALGAARLAALLIEVSTGSADIKRRLRLELSHNIGTADLAHEVRKRLMSLRKSTSFVGWRRRKALIKDLETQVAMIVEKLAPDDPALAFDLLWQFIEIAPFIYERVDDSRGEVGAVFRAALPHLEGIAPRAHLDPQALAAQVWAVVQDNGYGAWDGLIRVMTSALGPAGLARLKALVEAYAAAPLVAGAEDHAALQFLRQLRGGPDYATERKARFVQSCLQEIAEASGDTAAFIAQYAEADLQRPDIAAEVATLLLAEGKADAALDLLQNADRDGPGQGAWDNAFITTLLALDRDDDAQAHRWACFHATLHTGHLRDYLKRLPDFDDVEAEDRAKDHVLIHPDFSAALRFCLDWPDLLTAARLVETRADEIDGNRYDLLTPAAESLRARHPLAAVLLWRAMISHALDHGRSSRYEHAAAYLADCALADAGIADYKAFSSHAAFLENLKTRHDRKTAFWAKTS